jgi:hypothetical protein
LTTLATALKQITHKNKLENLVYITEISCYNSLHNILLEGFAKTMATILFELGGMLFEFNEEKNRKNISKHGIDFRSAARVFFDYDRIESIDEAHSQYEYRYNTIGNTTMGRIGVPLRGNDVEDVLFVVYTDRLKTEKDGGTVDVTRLISARLATEFERGVYYGKY